MTQLLVEQKHTLAPVCPTCRSTITTIDAALLRPSGDAGFGFGKRYLYACPACHAVLGISHRKGFWMG